MNTQIKYLFKHLLPMFRGNQAALSQYLGVNRGTLRKRIAAVDKNGYIVIDNVVYQRVGEVNVDFDPIR